MENGLYTYQGLFLDILGKDVRSQLLKHIPVIWKIGPFAIRNYLFSDQISEMESRLYEKRLEGFQIILTLGLSS